jgi:hypothetical protein
LRSLQESGTRFECVLFTPKGQDDQQDGSHRNGGIGNIEGRPVHRPYVKIQEIDDFPEANPI